MRRKTLLNFFIIFVLFLFSAVNAATSDKRYGVSSEKFIADWHNPKYIEKFETKTFKYNRTMTMFNMTVVFKQQIPMLILFVQGYQFYSNEYRMVGLKLSLDLCKIFNKNIYRIKELCLKAGFTKCPVEKGTYNMDQWSPDEFQFPPLIPEGKWMFDVGWYIDKTLTTKIANCKWYAKASYDVPWRQ